MKIIALMLSIVIKVYKRTKSAISYTDTFFLQNTATLLYCYSNSELPDSVCIDIAVEL